MSEITHNSQILIREDYVDAAERVAILAEKFLHGNSMDTNELSRRINRWKKLRKEILKEDKITSEVEVFS